GRLEAHLNFPGHFPLRREYAHYVGWVTEKLRRYALFGRRVTDIRLGNDEDGKHWVVTDDSGEQHQGRSLVLAPGRSPRIPPIFTKGSFTRVAHSSRYVPSVETLEERPRAVTVVGGSQSAVEIALDLTRRFSQTRVDL